MDKQAILITSNKPLNIDVLGLRLLVFWAFKPLFKLLPEVF